MSDIENQPQYNTEDRAQLWREKLVNERIQVEKDKANLKFLTGGVVGTSVGVIATLLVASKMNYDQMEALYQQKIAELLNKNPLTINATAIPTETSTPTSTSTPNLAETKDAILSKAQTNFAATNTPSVTPNPTMTPSLTLVNIDSSVNMIDINSSGIGVPKVTATLTPEPATATPIESKIDLRNGISQYSWDPNEILGVTENGILQLDVPKFRESLGNWLEIKGVKDGIRVNIAADMLSRPFGKNGMSQSHALNFWETEGGRGWTKPDSEKVFSWVELSNTNRQDLFSERNGEYRLGIVGQAKNIEQIVVRAIAERQLRIGGMQDATDAEISAYLRKPGVSKNIKNISSGILRSNGYKVEAKGLPEPADTFLSGFEDPNNQFNVCVAPIKKAVNRNLQKETSTNLNYKTGMEKANGNKNAETLTHNDGDSIVVFFLTEDSKGKYVGDVIRTVNIVDQFNPNVIQAVVDAVKAPVPIEAHRWIPCGNGQFRAVPTTVVPVGPQLHEGTPHETPGPGETPNATPTRFRATENPTSTAQNPEPTPTFGPTHPGTPTQPPTPTPGQGQSTQAATYTPRPGNTSTPFGQ